jgi:hypothetical protein
MEILKTHAVDVLMESPAPLSPVGLAAPLWPVALAAPLRISNCAPAIGQCEQQLRRGPRPRVRERQSEGFNTLVHRHGPDTGILPAGGGPGPKPDAAVSLWGCCAKGESPDPPPLSRRSRNCSRAVRHLLSRGKPAVRGRELNAEARPGQRALRGNIGGVPTLSWIARGVSIIPARRYATFPRICVNEEPGNAVPLMLREVAPRQVRLTIDLHEDDLREIALRGYEGAASTDRKARTEVAIFVSDKVF